MMAQKVCGKICERVQEGLNAGRCDILIESSIDQREGVVLVIVSPIPVDVFTGKPGVGSTRQKRSQDHSPNLKTSALKTSALNTSARDHWSNVSPILSPSSR